MTDKEFDRALERKLVVRNMDREIEEARSARLEFFEQLLGCRDCVICRQDQCPRVRR